MKWKLLFWLLKKNYKWGLIIMTSMGTSKQEYRYNILKLELSKIQRDMKCVYEACPSGSFTFDCLVERNNAIAAALTQAEEALKSDPTRFIK